MPSGTKPPADLSAVPLQTAVLCVNCECVTGGRKDRCPVCGSPSLLSLARVIGGTLSSQHSEDSQRPQFDVEITIGWKRIQPSDLSEALKSITSLIGPWLMRGQASCHINVTPVRELCPVGEENAA